MQDHSFQQTFRWDPDQNINWIAPKVKKSIEQRQKQRDSKWQVKRNWEEACNAWALVTMSWKMNSRSNSEMQWYSKYDIYIFHDGIFMALSWTVCFSALICKIGGSIIVSDIFFHSPLFANREPMGLCISLSLLSDLNLAFKKQSNVKCWHWLTWDKTNGRESMKNDQTLAAAKLLSC